MSIQGPDHVVAGGGTAGNVPAAARLSEDPSAPLDARLRGKWIEGLQVGAPRGGAA